MEIQVILKQEIIELVRFSALKVLGIQALVSLELVLGLGV